MKVYLNDSELAAAYTLGAFRATNHGSYCADKRLNRKVDRVEIDVLGAIGEFAWSKQLDRFPDFRVGPRRKTDYDSLINGKRWDIKATRNETQGLYVHGDKKIGDADYYALAVVRSNEVEFVGYAAEADIIREDRRRDIGYGPSFYLPQRDLRRFKCDTAAVVG